ncbi:hypothetical protein AM588_10003529 [Phytophthora nicotianae]|uniref:Uncharacterized protein n=1 Tax=Phytophthora nicotianae TaxID=4792 RepID=A0A0W8D726_PHYNI|nr:hypothetical protein AM588_10003529 [Phytophthora nicotianae]
MDAAGKTLKTASSALGGSAASAASSNSLLSVHSSANNVLTADNAAASTGNSIPVAADSGPVSLATLQEAARAQKEWAKYVAFDEDGRVLFSNVKPLDGEVAYVL